MIAPPTIIPAAGLGTRLRPLTDRIPKELLPLGSQPAILGALLEAEAAGVRELVVVLGPGKEQLKAWLDESIASGRWQGMRIAFASQPEPRGVIDAVERGRAALGDPRRYVVLFPDYVHLPDQRGLSQLVAGADGEPGTWFGLVRRTAERDRRMGRTAMAWTEAIDGGGAGRCRIVRIGAHPGAPPPPHHTTFAVLRSPEHQELLDAGPRDDARTPELLAALAARRLLFGVELDGELLDLGVRPGFDDAVERFDAGTARWRGRLP